MPCEETEHMLWREARACVVAMNPHEAKRHAFEAPVQYWPEWAQRDARVAYVFLKRAMNWEAPHQKFEQEFQCEFIPTHETQKHRRV